MLTPSTAASELYHAGLDRSDVPRLRLVEEQDFSFAPGVEVTEIDTVKGLEFDHAILVVHDESISDMLVYVGASRAIMSLTMIGSPDTRARLRV